MRNSIDFKKKNLQDRFAGSSHNLQVERTAHGVAGQLEDVVRIVAD